MYVLKAYVSKTLRALLVHWMEIILRIVIFIIGNRRCKDSICNDHKMILGSHLKKAQTI